MQRWKRISGVLLMVGGAAWLAKLAVIVGTDGRVTDTGAAGLFYILGLALMAVGSAGVGVVLAAGRGLVLRIVGGVGGLLAFFVVFAIVGDLLGTAIGERGPTYASDEVGILLAAVLGLGVGLWALTRSRPEEPRTA